MAQQRNTRRHSVKKAAARTRTVVRKPVKKAKKAARVSARKPAKKGTRGSARAPPKKARGSARSRRSASDALDTDSDSDALIEADEPDPTTARNDAAVEKSLYGGVVPDDEDPLEMSD